MALETRVGVREVLPQELKPSIIKQYTLTVHHINLIWQLLRPSNIPLSAIILSSSTSIRQKDK